VGEVQVHKNEVLNRVLLLMKYDNRQTLSENVEKISILEQPSPGTKSYASAVEAEEERYGGVKKPGFGSSLYDYIVWLDSHQNSPNFNELWFQYLSLLSNKNAPLLETQKKLLDNGYGSITPGNANFKKKVLTVGPAIAILENEIYKKNYQEYLRKIKEFESKVKPGFISGTVNFAGFPQGRKTEKQWAEFVSKSYIQPNKPQYQLMNSMSQLKSDELGIRMKTAQQLLNDENKKREKNTATSKGCPFSNKSEGNSFRSWVNDNFSEIAKEIDLDPSGDFCNSYVKKAANYKISSGTELKPGLFDGLTLKTLFELNEDFDFDPTKFYDPNSDDEIKQEPMFSDVGKIEPKLMISKPKGQPFDIKFIKKRLFNISEKENKQTLSAPKPPEQKPEDYINDEDLIKIFGGKEKIQKSFDECPFRLSDFFDGILSGQIKNPLGHQYGTYALNKKNEPYFVVWPKNEPIPCDSEFWDEWGGVIQWGGMILSIALMVPSLGGSSVLGLALTSRIALAAAIDTGVNLTSAYMNKRAGRDDEAALDVFTAFLSVFVEVKGISKLLTGGMDDFAEEAILQKFKNANIKSYKDLLKFTDSLSTKDKKLFHNILDRKETKNTLKDFANGKADEIGKRVEGRITKSVGKSSAGITVETILKNIQWKLPVVLIPQITYYGAKLIGTLDATFQAINHREITKQEWERFKRYIGNQDPDTVAENIKNNPAVIANAMSDPENAENYINQKLKSTKKEPCKCKNEELMTANDCIDLCVAIANENAKKVRKLQQDKKNKEIEQLKKDNENAKEDY
jgi:hypothetical protein